MNGGDEGGYTGSFDREETAHKEVLQVPETDLEVDLVGGLAGQLGEEPFLEGVAVVVGLPEELDFVLFDYN